MEQKNPLKFKLVQNLMCIQNTFYQRDNLKSVSAQTRLKVYLQDKTDPSV